jgi:hypothetical protein
MSVITDGSETTSHSEILGLNTDTRRHRLLRPGHYRAAHGRHAAGSHGHTSEGDDVVPCLALLRDAKQSPPTQALGPVEARC